MAKIIRRAIPTGAIDEFIAPPPVTNNNSQLVAIACESSAVRGLTRLDEARGDQLHLDVE